MHADTNTALAGPDSDNVELVAEILAILADSTRIKIVLALHEAPELSVGAIAEIVGKKPAGVSQHLARMRMARMVTTRQDGTSVLYRLTDEHALAVVFEAFNQVEHVLSNGTPPRHHQAAK